MTTTPPPNAGSRLRSLFTGSRAAPAAPSPARPAITRAEPAPAAHYAKALGTGEVPTAPHQTEAWIFNGDPKEILVALLRDAGSTVPVVGPEGLGPLSFEVDLSKEQTAVNGATLKWAAKVLKDKSLDRTDPAWEQIKGWMIKVGNEQSTPRGQAAINMLQYFGFPALPLLQGKAPLQKTDGTWEIRNVVAKPKFKGVGENMNADITKLTGPQAHMMMLYAILIQFVAGNNDLHDQQFKLLPTELSNLLLGDVDSSFLIRPEKIEKWEIETRTLPVVKKQIGLANPRAPSDLWEAFTDTHMRLNLDVGSAFAKQVASVPDEAWHQMLSPLKANPQSAGYATYEELCENVIGRVRSLPEKWESFRALELEASVGRWAGIGDAYREAQSSVQEWFINKTPLVNKSRAGQRAATALAENLKLIQDQEPPKELLAQLKGDEK